MSENIIEILSHQQGIEHLSKVDPNTQSIQEKQSDAINLLQAAIPSVLAGFYMYSRNDESAKMIADTNGKQAWIDTLFGTEKTTLLNRIAIYAAASLKEVETKMEEIANETVIVLKDNSGNTGAGIKTLLTNQRNSILQYLPGAIGIGDILNDSTLDDRTNKMQGPVSSLMHKIEKQFTSADINDKKNF
ncbi:MAG: hypothetical protein ABUT20_03485 [Bacteroidota bacterium]